MFWWQWIIKYLIWFMLALLACKYKINLVLCICICLYRTICRLALIDTLIITLLSTIFIPWNHFETKFYFLIDFLIIGIVNWKYGWLPICMPYILSCMIMGTFKCRVLCKRVSMTQLLSHTFAHLTGPSFGLKAKLLPNNFF